MKPRHLILTLLALLTSITASAAKWTDANGTIWNFTTSGNSATIYKTYGQAAITGTIPTNLTIPATVYIGETPYTITSIGEYAFSGCSSLTSIYIPEGVTSIGRGAILGCSSLTSINIPKGVTSIGVWAFEYCSSLTSITVENGNTKYDSRNNCNAIIETASNTLIAGCKNTIIPESVTCIGESAFMGCSGLTSINIPDGVTSIGREAFKDCSGLTSVTIPESVTSIGGSAFDGCSGLTSVTIGNSVTSIGEYAFRDCSNLTKAEFASIAQLCSISFNSSYSNPLSYAHHLYIDGTEVVDVVIPNSVTSIGDYTFRNCSSLASINIPDGVTSIGIYAFSGCSSLTSITIPESVTSIGGAAFNGCSSLTSINIPDGVTSIGQSAFYGCSSLTSINIPDGVTSIERYAFSNCSGLTSITIPDGVTSIGMGAFQDCSGLKEVNFNATNCTEMGSSENHPVFEGCSSLTTLNIGEKVQTIPAYAFKDCSGLTSITIPNSVTSIGGYAFDGCSGLTSITIPADVTSIGANAFRGCNSLNHVEFASLEDLHNIQFGNCSANPLYRGHNLYFGGALVTQVNIPSTWTSIPKHMLNGCTSMTQIVIPNGVTNIGPYSLCETGLTSITIPKSVSSIDYYAFYGCSNLTNVIVENPSPVTITSDVFSNRTNATLYVLAGTKEAYQAADYWKEFKEIRYLTLNGNTATVPCGNGSVDLNFNITGQNPNTVEVASSPAGLSGALTIPNYVQDEEGRIFAVTGIGAEAFKEQAGLTEINLPEGITYIGANAFEGTALTMVSLPSTLTAIGAEAFKMSDLESVVIPDGVTAIGASAFSGCGNLQTVRLGSGVTSIGSAAFSDCPELTSVCVRMTTPVAITSSVFSNRANATLHVPIGCEEAYAQANNWRNFKNVRDHISFADANVKAICLANWDTDGDGELSSDEAAAVTSLGEVFKNNSSITAFNELQYFTGLTTIGDRAFYNCSHLTSVQLPTSVTSIGQFAFYGSGLESIAIPNSITEIPLRAFSKCSNLARVEFAENSALRTIGESAFDDCGKLQSINIPDGVETIGQLAFWSCASLTEVSIPANLNAIERETFYGCSSLTSITIPESVTSIGSYAFSGCSSLTSITIPESVTSIGGSAFYNCSSLTSINIPDGVTSIGEGAFSGCSSLTSITIPESVTSIGSYAFSGCSSLTSITISDGVTSIGSLAFYGCSSLTSISIPESVTSIGSGAFSNCSNLTKAEFASIAHLCSIPFSSVDSNPLSYAHHLYIDGTEVVDVVIPNSVTSIGGYTFYGCSSLTSVDIPNSVTSIESKAFDGCSALTRVSIPPSITSIGSYAFGNGNNIESVYITDLSKWLSISFNTGANPLRSGAKLYLNNEEVRTLTIPEGTESILTAAFEGCSSLTSVIIPSSTTRIGSYAFYNCSNLASVTIPNSVTSIGESAFRGCSSLTSINIPEGVTSIGMNAFSSCSSLTSITVRPLTPPTLSLGAFNSISSDAVIYVPNKSLDAYKTSWSAYASMIQPFYTLTYQAVYNGEVVKSATVEAHPGDAIPAMPEELSCDFVTLTLEGTMPASVSDDHVLSYNVQWNGPFQFSTTEADATWYNLKVRLNKYMHVNETEPYFSNTDATPRELSQAEYQWAFGGNPYEVVLYNRSSDFSKSMTPANGFANHSPVVMRDGTYKWEIGQMYYELADGTNRPDFNLSVKDGSNTAFLNDFSQEDLALLVTSEYGDEGNRITTELAPSPNWISGEDVSCIAGNKVTIPLSLDNLDDIAGVQFELNVPAGMTLKKASVASRASAFSASFALASEGVYTLLIIQKTLGETIATIDGHEGVFLNLELESDESMQLGDRTITYSDIVLTKADGNTVNTVDNTSTVTIVEPEPGDANRDGKVNVADIVAVANYILHSTPAKFSFDAANVNGDSTVNVADVVGIANIIINANQGNQVKALTGTEQELDPQ